MKALTLYEPWASLVAKGEKKIETRSWATKYRGPIAIHAAAQMPAYVKKLCPKFANLLGIYDYECSWLHDLACKSGPYGKVVATATLVNCLEVVGKAIFPADGTVILKDNTTVSGNELAFGDYTIGRYAWILKDIKPLADPIRLKGCRGFGTGIIRKTNRL